MAIIAAAAWGIALVLGALDLDPPKLPTWALLRHRGEMQVSPEPIERAVFVILAALTPPALLAWAWLLRQKMPTARMIPALSFLTAALFCGTFVSTEIVDLMFFPSSWSKAHRVELVSVAALLAVTVLALSMRSSAATPPTRRGAWVAVAFAALSALVLQVLPFRVFSIAAVTRVANWGVSFDTVMYALSQVVAGKTLLADLPSQYGFFPELVAPVFKVIGLSVTTFTAFFAVLQIAALCAIALVLRRHVRSHWIAIATFLTALIPTSLFFLLNGDSAEPYFQYFPIRFFWPAIALLLFSRYVARPNHLALAVMGTVAGIALVWNIDTGIPIIAAIGATMIARAIVAPRAGRLGIAPAFTFGIIALVIAVGFLALLKVKASGPLHIDAALEYQRVFYGAGFGMLPMPLSAHPWQAVLGVYLAGLITALAGFAKSPGNKTFDVIFCASILGTGLFTYYQGRSHDYCLLMVSWPALLVAAILADQVLQAVAKDRFPRSALLLALPFTFFVSLGTVAIAAAAPPLLSADFQTLANWKTPRDPVVADELAFMRDTRNGRRCLILAQRHAIYYAELGYSSPLAGPGLIETIVQPDLDRLIAGATPDQVQCVFLGVTPGSETYIDVRDEELLKMFPTHAKSRAGTMFLLEPAHQ
ncbi:hypothetical protein SAMN05518669_103333 [Variovorax sp. YR634]|nr:hypothetical protein SAMN05518669_103333 [Variovorax sp. YR634]